MGEAWIDDSKRPGGIGRAEKERVFWERVASGRSRVRRDPKSAAGSSDPGNPSSAPEAPRAAEGPWESAQIAVVTMLTVVVFGLGWVTLELEAALVSSGYDGRVSGAEIPASYAWSTDSLADSDTSD